METNCTEASKQRGVTLLELMIVVAIVAMIAAFAYPSYTQYIVNTKRTAATSTLLQIADRQQQFFMDNKRYANNLTDLGLGANPLWVADDGSTVPAGDADAVYIFAVFGVDATNYIAIAAPWHDDLEPGWRKAGLWWWRWLLVGVLFARHKKCRPRAAFFYLEKAVSD
jgi:type IV pilus assembly protein PilE